MKAFINQPTALPLSSSPQAVRRSCQNCDYIGDTPDVKCPSCGKIPLLSLSKLKSRGAIKIGRGILSIAVLAAAPFGVSSFSSFDAVSFIGKLFRGDVPALMLVYWTAFFVLLGGTSEIVAGFWLMFYAKPNRTIKTLSPILYALYVVAAVFLAIFSQINN